MMTDVKLNTSIESLRKKRLLSGRTYNCLFNSGLFTVEDILKYIQKRNDLKKIYNLDRKGELEIKNVLLICVSRTEKYENLDLGVTTLDYYDLLSNTLKSVLELEFEKAIKDNRNSENPLPIYYTDIQSFFGAIDNRRDEVLKFKPFLTKDQKIAYRLWHISLIDKILLELHQENGKEEPVITAFSDFLNNLKKSDLLDTNDLHYQRKSHSSEGKDNSKNKPKTISSDSRSKGDYGTFKEKDNNSACNDNTSTESESISVRRVTLFAPDITHSAFEVKEIDDILQTRYDRLCEATLSTRAMHFKQDYIPNYRDIMYYLDKPLEEYSQLCPGRHMGQTLNEIHRMAQFFRSEVVDVYENFNRGWEFEDFEESFEEFHNFYNKDFKDLKADFTRGDLNYDNYDNFYSIEQFHNYINKKFYPYLDKGEYDFVKGFTEQNGFRPIFYLAYKALPHSRASECIAFNLRYGVGSGFELPLEEVAGRFRLTMEETLDLINRHDAILKDLMIFPYEKENYENIIASSNLISEATPEAAAVISQERLPKGFWIFSVLFALFFDYRISRAERYPLAISPVLEPHLLMNGALDSLIDDFNRRYKKGFTEEQFIPFSHFNSNIPKEFNKELVTLFSLLAKDKEAVTVKGDGVLFGVQINEEVYKILRQQGNLMPIEAIFERFKETHPNHEFSKPSQLAAYLRTSDKIKKIENHNLYGLPGWHQKVFYGNIRDLLQQTLKKSKTPMLPKELYNAIRPHFPSTSTHSIRNSMQSDTLGRFVQFEGGYYGLSNKKYSSEFVKVVSKNAPVTKPLEECSFDEMINRVEEFIQKNQRLPLKSGTPEEIALRCCLNNEKPYKRKLSSEDSQRLQAIMKHYSDLGYPGTLAELKFLQKCQEYKRFVKEHKARPGGPNSLLLAAWFRNNLYEYSHYTWHKDKRVDYLLDLVDFLESQGFEIDLPDKKRRH